MNITLTYNFPFSGSVEELHRSLSAQMGDDWHCVMFTLTSEPAGAGHQFRAWKGPFASFRLGHVDTGRQEDRLFSIAHDDLDELLQAIRPFIASKAEWRSLDGGDDVRLWLSYLRS